MVTFSPSRVNSLVKILMAKSGHKDVQSVNNYSTVSEAQHRNYGNLLAMTNMGNTEPENALEKPSALTLHSDRPSCPVSSAPASNVATQSNTLTQSHTSGSTTNKSTSTDIIHTKFSGPIYGGVFITLFLGTWRVAYLACPKISKDPASTRLLVRWWIERLTVELVDSISIHKVDCFNFQSEIVFCVHFPCCCLSWPISWPPNYLRSCSTLHVWKWPRHDYLVINARDILIYWLKVQCNDFSSNTVLWWYDEKRLNMSLIS